MHFTAMPSNYESGSDVDGSDNDKSIVKEEVAFDQIPSIDMTASIGANVGNCVGSDLDSSSVSEDDTSMLEMIMIKDVDSGTEVRIFLSVICFTLRIETFNVTKLLLMQPLNLPLKLL